MKYLHKYYTTRAIKDHPFNIDLQKDYELIIVIPCYNESYKTLIKTLNSLKAGNNTQSSTLCLVLINDKSTDQNELINGSKALFNQLCAVQTDLTRDYLDFQFQYIHFKQKKAGVGLARKILMDAAFEYFYKREVNGLIVNLDADTTVAPNYISALAEIFSKNPGIDALSIAFEHQVYEPDKHPNEMAALLYELHLRYFVNMQRLIKLPYAYQTIGSAMAVKSQAYAKVGGMNKRQAGEDFYFMHKFSSLGTLKDLSTTTVFPSCRPSDRVPFGTGKAINEIISNAQIEYTSYHPESFILIKEWITHTLEQFEYNIASIEQYDHPVSDFLKSRDMIKDIRSIYENTSNYKSFRKRFYQWFNPFELMKCLHYLRDSGYPNQSIDNCTSTFFDIIGVNKPISLERQLNWFRDYDRQNDYYAVSKDYY